LENPRADGLDAGLGQEMHLLIKRKYILQSPAAPLEAENGVMHISTGFHKRESSKEKITTTAHCYFYT